MTINTMLLEMQTNGLPYEDYLLTPHWKRTRLKALKHAGFKCQLCGDNGNHLEVHHNNYECLWQEKLSDLIVLCPECHARHHAAIGLQETHVGIVCPHCGKELAARVELVGEVVV